jgi:hypothetical protein
MRSQVLFVLALAGCGPQFAVVPQGGMPTAMGSSGSITVTAFAEQWSADPDDLADYLTPIAVELYNAGPYEVRVSFADFALRDERGFRFAAINPFIPAALGRLELERGPLLAARGGFGGRGGFGSHAARGGGRIVVGPPSGRRWGGYGHIGWGGGWSGYHIAGGLRGYYGPGFGYWYGPGSYPPFYGQWVWWWGPAYYPSPRPSADVLSFALPEGVLAPGGRVNGYLYFQKATDHARVLDLSWEAHEARSGGVVGSAAVRMQVLER